jgi:hypothetical protein
MRPGVPVAVAYSWNVECTRPFGEVISLWGEEGRMRVTGMALAAAIVFLSFDAQASNCVPGAQAQCACPGGGSGIQVCSDDGSRFGACSNCTTPAPQAMQTMYTPLRPATRRSSPALWKAGLVTLVVSAVLVPVGGGMIAAGAASGDCHHHDTDLLCGAGGTMAGVGLLGIAGGILMMVTGGQRVPLDGAPQAWWAPTPRISSQGGALTWAF